MSKKKRKKESILCTLYKSVDFIVTAGMKTWKFVFHHLVVCIAFHLFKVR